MPLVWRRPVLLNCTAFGPRLPHCLRGIDADTRNSDLPANPPPPLGLAWAMLYTFNYGATGVFSRGLLKESAGVLEL